MPTDPTLDPTLRSWVASAHADGTDFPLQNLPLGAFTSGLAPRVGVAIGDDVLDLRAARDQGHLDGLDARLVEAAGAETLNALFALGRPALSAQSAFRVSRPSDGGQSITTRS